MTKWINQTLMACAVWGLLFTTQVSAEEPAPLKSAQEIPWQDRPWQERAFHANYEDLHTFKHKQTYFFDPFIWAYTKEFAEKFGMPKEWIDPGLKGAQAVAWRMTNIGQTTCGLGGRAENCWPTLTCQMDIYFDSNAPLPWRYKDVVRDNFWRGVSSGDYVPSRSPQSRKFIYQKPGEKGEPLYSDGITYLKGGVGSANGMFWIVYFDREFEPGITQIGFTSACPDKNVDSAAELRFFSEEEQKRTRGRISKYAHIVEFSQPYMKKITEVYAVQNKPNQDVTKRLMEDFFSSRKSDPNFAPRQ